MKTHSLFCLKVIECSVDNFDSFVNEYKVQSYVRHSNLVECYGGMIPNYKTWCSSSDFFDEQSNSPEEVKKFYILMEFLDSGTLKHENENIFKPTREIDQSKKEANLTRIQRFLSQVVPAIAHMHDRGIIHRDLKPMNIFRTNVLLNRHSRIFTRLGTSEARLTQIPRNTSELSTTLPHKSSSSSLTTSLLTFGR